MSVTDDPAIGTAIVMASGIYILFREAHLGLPRGVA